MQEIRAGTSHSRPYNELRMKAASWLVVAAIVSFACSKSPNPEQPREGFAVAPKVHALAPLAVETSGSIRADQASLNAATDVVNQSAVAATPDLKVIAAGTASEIAPSMLIRTGQASVEVESLDPALAKMRQLAAQLGGYIANSSLSGGRDQVRSATLELKIPAARYDQAAAGLTGIGKLESINTAAEDVGEEYVDITARVANAHRLEERLVNLLATRTGKLEDVLAVERELARVREQIERYDGRMRFLKTRSAVSTLSVTLHEPFPILGRVPGENPIAVAVRQAWRNFVAFFAALIAALGVLVPVGVMAGGGWYLYRGFRKRRISDSSRVN